jgi:hypothetical protein
MKYEKPIAFNVEYERILMKGQVHQNLFIIGQTGEHGRPDQHLKINFVNALNIVSNIRPLTFI